MSKCNICNTSVFPVDPQINLNGSVYHKVCAKCVDCRCQITVSNFTKSGDTLLCKTHYIKRFNEQGTHLGSDKFNKQANRGLAAISPSDPSQAPAAAPSSTTSPKDFNDPERSATMKERMKKFSSMSAIIKCAICDRSVYANDAQIVLDGLSYHRACAKCTECKCQITISNFTKSGTTLYCKTHYIKKFKEEGTILGSEKFTHQSAPGKFAGTGFTIPGTGIDNPEYKRSVSAVEADNVEPVEPAEPPSKPAPAPAPVAAPVVVEESPKPTSSPSVPVSAPAPVVVEEPIISESDVKLEEAQVESEPAVVETQPESEPVHEVEEPKAEEVEAEVEATTEVEQQEETHQEQEQEEVKEEKEEAIDNSSPEEENTSV